MLSCILGIYSGRGDTRENKKAEGKCWCHEDRSMLHTMEKLQEHVLMVFYSFFPSGWTTEPKWSGNCGLEFYSSCTKMLSLPSWDILQLNKTSQYPSRWIWVVISGKKLGDVSLNLRKQQFTVLGEEGWMRQVSQRGHIALTPHRATSSLNSHRHTIT